MNHFIKRRITLYIGLCVLLLLAVLYLQTPTKDETHIRASNTNSMRKPLIPPKVPSNSNKDPYFNSYAHYSIHETMLKDKVRTLTYRDSMLQNRHLFKGKIVLDVGCGTGILSMFAAQAGAAKVIGIDASPIIFFAKEIVRANKLDNVITLVHGKVEDIQLPHGVDKVDIIVSEWMGYCLLYESMLQSVIYARDKWLTPGGLVFPDKATLYITAVEDSMTGYIKHHFNFWKDVYGFDMSVFRGVALSEVVVDAWDSHEVLTDSYVIKEVDVQKITANDVPFTSGFRLRSRRNGSYHALITYFSVEFTKCRKKTGFVTGPEQIYTHWGQTAFFLGGKDMKLMEGEEISGTFSMAINKQYKRNLDFVLHVDFKGNQSEMTETFKYTMK